MRHGYDDIISLENLLAAWKEFKSGKKGRKDVQIFERDLMRNIILLHTDLVNKTYKHSLYEAFNISDPKPRNIHKASVKDRLLHHAIYRILYPYFDKKFIHDSYSCRFEKGTHKALNRFRQFGRRASKNHGKTVWVLKCDIRKFFASIDQSVLIGMIESYIPDKQICWLLSRIVKSFHSTREGIGLPLGNLTSQLLVNVYMNTFDHFVKRELKVRYYIRYADDFVLLSQDKKWLKYKLEQMNTFLSQKLKLQLHPDKVFIKTIASGVDFLGWVHFPDHRIPRTVMKKRMFRRIGERQENPNTIQSYLGLLSHGNTEKLVRQVEILRDSFKA